ncbi:hydroxymethylglutaryl-CoA lyase [Roseomonas sp. CCTCC AB2023176]|uniref:hydroxymethylglutaryl-CoA lyase n=1 Tax=Roseomonas sp. CCTCC AB2023176 TaxID=3342640 RepID=UPI0035D955CF
MTDLPARVEIQEEGPREGFQIESAEIPTADKVALVDALSATGLRRIQVASFVSPKLVPGWADAEDVVRGFAPHPGVEYHALWFNARGLERALASRDRLTVFGSVTVSASEAFSRRNLNRDHVGQLAAQRENVAAHLAAGVAVTRVGVQAAFGCNFSGDVPVAKVVGAVADALAIAEEAGAAIERVSLADTMGWATPARVEAVVGVVRSRWPEMRLVLHLHDTRGLGIANAMAGLRLGVTTYDAAVGGLGGVPSRHSRGRRGTWRRRSWSSSARRWGSRRGWTSTRCWRRGGWRSGSSGGGCRARCCGAAGCGRCGDARRREAAPGCRLRRRGGWTSGTPRCAGFSGRERR